MTRPILVTRPPGQADDLCRLLWAHGIPSVSVPTVAIDTTSTAADLDAMLEHLDDAAWLVLTSANGARAVVARMEATGRRLPTGVRVAAVGPATAGALARASVPVAHVPEAFLTVAIADGLGDVRDRRVVLASADVASPGLSECLRQRGAKVEEVVAYRTIEGPAGSRDQLHRILHTDLSGIAFTSGSTVRGVMRLASPIDRNRARSVPAYCIGPVTASAARQFGFDIAAVAARHTAAGLADAIASHLAGDSA